MPKPKSKRRKKIIVFSSLCVLVGTLGGIAIVKNKEVAITVQTEKVARRNLIETVLASGKIQPVVQVKISPEVSGEIIALPVKEGQAVKKGDLLVKIKPENYVASRDSSKASYERSLTSSNSAWASLERADLEFKRASELHKSRLLSDSAFQEAKTTYAVASANHDGSKREVAMALAALQKAEDELSKTTIYSPVTGTITKLNSQLGERVVGTALMAGTEIMTISDLNEMEARVDIGEIDVVLMQVGLPAHLEVDAFKDRKFNGTVTEIANSAKAAPGGGTSQDATKFEVKIRIAEKEAFRPGMSVTAEIETRHRTNVVAVPIQSVTTRLPKATNNPSAKTNSVAAGASNSPATSAKGTNEPSSAKDKKGEKQKPLEVVFVLKEGKAKMVPVKHGISDDSYMEITEGLKEGEEVVSGNYRAINRDLEDGKMVLRGAKTESESQNR